MKKKIKVKLLDAVDMSINGEFVTFGVGGYIEGQEIGSIIANGDRVQFLNEHIENIPFDVDPAEYLITVYHGFPYTERYRLAEIEVDVPDEEVPAEKEPA